MEKSSKTRREFVLGAVRILPKCAKRLRKNLQEEFYILNKRCILNSDKKTITLSTYNSMQDFYGKGICIQAIVGTNGSGKSSLFDIIYRIINNLSCLLSKNKSRRAAEDLYYVEDLFAELYYIINDRLYCISCEGDKISFQKDNTNTINLYAYSSNGVPSNEYILVEDFISYAKSSLFYTIVTNYSIQAFSAQDYADEPCFDITKARMPVEDKIWINSLFHKNDGYMTPIVLNPYRDNGCIDQNKEHKLTLYRLSAEMIYAEKHNKDFMKDYKLNQILYEFNDTRLSQKYADEGIDLNIYWNFRPNSLVPDYGTIIFEEYKRIWNLNLSLDQTMHHSTMMYLIYKTFSIANRYPSYDNYIEIGRLNNINVKADDNTQQILKSLVQKISKDKTHISLKIRQVINFAKMLSRRTSINNFFSYNDYVTLMVPEIILGSMEKIQEFLPPSFFDIKITLDKYHNNNKINSIPIPLEHLSSGERQYLYTFSTYIYHILNLLSIQGSNRVKYRRFNLILDEVEICFHPEFQRRFISELIGYITRMRMTRHATFCITIATHSPFILSDIPQNNILYLNEGMNVNSSKFKKPFVANICDILYQSFFLKNGFIGEYARCRINEILSRLQKKNVRLSNEDKCKINDIIDNIGDPLIQMHINQLLEPDKEK